jgi:hypothetical protein
MTQSTRTQATPAKSLSRPADMPSATRRSMALPRPPSAVPCKGPGSWYIYITDQHRATSRSGHLTVRPRDTASLADGCAGTARDYLHLCELVVDDHGRQAVWQVQAAAAAAARRHITTSGRERWQVSQLTALLRRRARHAPATAPH